MWLTEVEQVVPRHDRPALATASAETGLSKGQHGVLVFGSFGNMS